MIMSVSEICTLIGVEEKQFLKFSKRYEQKITDLGYTFTKEGKGKKAIYTLDKEVELQEDSNDKLKEILVSEYGFNGRYKVDEYIKLINYIKTTDGFNTSSELGQALGMNNRTVERYIRVLRDKQILKPKHLSKDGYYGIKIKTYKEVIDITQKVKDAHYDKSFYFQDMACENCIGQARKQILIDLGVINLWKIYKQEFTTEFISKICLE